MNAEWGWMDTDRESHIYGMMKHFLMMGFNNFDIEKSKNKTIIS